MLTHTLKHYTKKENSFTDPQEPDNAMKFMTENILVKIANEHSGARVYRKRLKSIPSK